jgi:hypothetical protein
MRFKWGLLCAMALAPACAGEVELSLTVKGSADEIAQVLDFLRASGLSGGGGEAVQVQVESSFTRPEAAPAPSAPPEPPKLALTNPIIAPEMVKPGAAALLSVDVVDAERKIDTVAAVVGEKQLAVDLYDNGMQGDVAAGDGRWTILLGVPADFADGVYSVTLQAYDAKGMAVTEPGPDGSPVAIMTTVALNVRK